MAVSDYSTTPGSNTSISGINIAEGCPPANMNNAVRQLMADLKGYTATFIPFTPAGGIAATTVAAAIVEARSDAIAAIPGAATTSTSGLMSAADKIKLNGIDAEAQTNPAAISQANWTAGTSTTEGPISPAKLDAATRAKLSAVGSAPMFACRAWGDLNGDDVSIRAGGNVASFTRQSTGNYTVTFAEPMPSANYSIVFGVGNNDTSNVGYFIQLGARSSKTVNGFRIQVTRRDSERQFSNADDICFAVFR